MTNGGRDWVEELRAFYAAISAKDAVTLQHFVEERFTSDTRISWPESLPHGGSVTGKDRLAKIFGGMSLPSAPLGVSKLELIDLIDGGDRMVAHLEFEWFVRVGESTLSMPTSALELWTFRDDSVDEIRAYYWDSAAMNRITRRPAP
ncbi:nuclear transport factor 2 family protein [Mycobacterium syngnathidarum]